MEHQSARIKHIVIYPVKSCGRIELEQAFLTMSGLRSGNYADHEFMVVSNDREFAEANNKPYYDKLVHYFLTQRNRRNKKDKPQGLSAMASIKPELHDGRLRLTWNYKEPIEIPYDKNGGTYRLVRIWEDESLAVDQGDEIANWFSDHLDMGVRLVKAADSFERMSRQNYMQNYNPLRFQDGYPIHWFPIESVQELSQIAKEEIPWQSFRPQIVVEGMPAQYEHKIHRGRINVIPFVDPKPCSRCEVPRVDQETGELRALSPLAVLKTYKKWIDVEGKNAYVFGENMLPLGACQIAVGDTLIATSHREPPLRYGAAA